MTPSAAVGSVHHLGCCWARWVEQRALASVLVLVLMLGPVLAQVLVPVLAWCWDLM